MTPVSLPTRGVPGSMPLYALYVYCCRLSHLTFRFHLSLFPQHSEEIQKAFILESSRLFLGTVKKAGGPPHLPRPKSEIRPCRPFLEPQHKNTPKPCKTAQVSWFQLTCCVFLNKVKMKSTEKTRKPPLLTFSGAQQKQAEKRNAERANW